MPRNATVNSAINGTKESGSVWMDLFRANNDRTHRFNRLLIDEAERTQEERAEFVREFLARPTAVSDNTRELFQTWTRRNRRRLELVRTMFDDLRDMTSTTRSLYERMSDANRQTVTATARAGREAAAEVAGEASDLAENVSDAADSVERSLRRQARNLDPRNN
ncbi:MAG: hypothetical protein WD904_02020 [Dehalococcoidia bacterium]